MNTLPHIIYHVNKIYVIYEKKKHHYSHHIKPDNDNKKKIEQLNNFINDIRKKNK